jgi:hypothetical protein
VCCPSARTIGVVSLTITRWPSPRAQARRQGRLLTPPDGTPPPLAGVAPSDGFALFPWPSHRPGLARPEGRAGPLRSCYPVTRRPSWRGGTASCPMIRGERGESDVLAEEAGDRRPIIGQGDLGLGWSGRGQVVAPDPAAEPQPAVAGVLARLPGDGARRVEHLHPVGHLVVPVRMISVVHGHTNWEPSGNDHGWPSRNGVSRASRTAVGEVGLIAVAAGLKIHAA